MLRRRVQHKNNDRNTRYEAKLSHNTCFSYFTGYHCELPKYGQRGQWIVQGHSFFDSTSSLLTDRPSEVSESDSSFVRVPKSAVKKIFSAPSTIVENELPNVRDVQDWRNNFSTFQKKKSAKFCMHKIELDL